ncbi:diguanylate cyclase [Alteromonas sediminis]|uniref:Diguanylate cyclase n=1 Tax=Alteromonas sediminis TaxID=2259342 RepID=A0A3N5Y238_9ALTE|nr:diguanylate cyclase [Alteromonas sediminis]RPJ67360.1 diguanylate cyclase [Alteromonas sediminis]
MNATKPTISVFIVDDDSDDVYIVKQILKDDATVNFSLTHFYSIEEITEAIGKESCDVILLDLGLSQTKGLDSLKHLNEQQFDIPAIVLTGFDEEEFGEEAIKLGAQDYIPKAELRGTLLRRVIRFTLERYKLVAELKRLSQKDSLTSLSNKNAFHQCLKTAYERLKRYGQPFSLMFIDLDDFKPINDSFGHAFGDEVLRIIGQRLVSFGRTTDCIARVGGDEFAIILPNLTDKVALENTAVSKLHLLRQPIIIDTEDGPEEVHIGASIGIAIPDASADSPKSVLENADKAMYEAKSNGGNKVAFYLN